MAVSFVTFTVEPPVPGTCNVVTPTVPSTLSFSMIFTLIVSPCGAAFASSLATIIGVGVDVTVTLMVLAAVPPLPSLML